MTACPDSLLLKLLLAQVICDEPRYGDRGGELLAVISDKLTVEAAVPLYAVDLEYAQAIATFDEQVSTLALLPDVRGCADPATYRSEALACLARAKMMITDMHRHALYLAEHMPGQSALVLFIGLRDAEHAAVAARRLRRMEARARQEEREPARAEEAKEGERARHAECERARAEEAEEGGRAREEQGNLALVQRVMAVRGVLAGEGTAHDLREAAVGWRESADQGDTSPQFLVGVMYARGGGGMKKNLPMGKRYLELSAAAGNEAAVALLKELRKCVACNELDVHHMICSRCRKVRYCGKDCQRRHWHDQTDPHKLSCVPRRESTAAVVGSANPSADDAECATLGALELEVPTAQMHAAKMDAASSAVDAARVASNAALAELKWATAAATAAPAASKKELDMKAKLVARAHAAGRVSQAALEAFREASAVFKAAATAVFGSALHDAEEAYESLARPAQEAAPAASKMDKYMKAEMVATVKAAETAAQAAADSAGGGGFEAATAS